MDVEECNGLIETLEKEIVDLRFTVRKARLDVRSFFLIDQSKKPLML
jgi:hypothetical protein